MEAVLKFDLNLVKNRRRHYEVVCVIAPDAKDAALEAAIQKWVKVITDSGLLLRKDDWGKKRMAYECQKHQTARYFYFRFISNQETLKEFERLISLEAIVLKFQTVRLSDALSEEAVKTLVEKAPNEPSAVTTESEPGSFGSAEENY